MRPLLLSLVAATTGGCIDLVEGMWYSPEVLDGPYEWFHNEVPEELIEEVELAGLAVEGEDEAPTLAGVWAHQCQEDGSACASPSGEGFDASRQGTTLLYFHGNSTHLGHYWDRIQILWRLGYEVFAVDYRGYGRSSGDPSEEGIYADGRVALQHVKERLQARAGTTGDLPDAEDLGLLYYGYSLGTTVTIQLATEDRPVAMVTEAALGSAQAFVDDATGVGLSSTILMDTRFDNIGKIPFIGAPKLIMHGTDDDFVRFEFSEALYEAARDPKRFYVVDGAQHGNVPCPTTDPEDMPVEVPCLASESYVTNVTAFFDDVAEGELR